MIGRVCLLLEALSIVICLHHLYGEKFKLDIKTVGFLAVDMIIMEFINHYDMPSTYTLIIYPIVAIYCGIKFGFKIKALIINSILYLAVIGVFQLLTMISCHYFLGINLVDNWVLLGANVIVLLAVILILPVLKINRVSDFLQKKEKIFALSMIVCIIAILSYVIDFKILERLNIKHYVLLFMSIVLICVLIVQLGNSRLKSKQMEIELKMHKLYANSFEGLITNIRVRQHEFDNHINTIYSQHYLCKSLEELEEMQRQYCQVLLKENRYNKLLTGGNSIIIGFLYGKFMEIDKCDIDVSYEVQIKNFEVGVPVYKWVEILGDLINNAVDAIRNAEEENRKLHVLIKELDGAIDIEVRNVSDTVNYNEIQSFFEKGYSKKGLNRGLGLYNVKTICNEYMLDITCCNKMVDGKNWLSFAINNRK